MLSDMLNTARVLATFVALAIFLTACGSSTDDPVTTEAPPDTETSSDDGGDPTGKADDTTTEPDDVVASATGVDLDLFFDGALAEEVTTEDCTLSGGTLTTCYRITVAGDAVTYETGPFCPDTITDGADAGGIWFDGTGVYDLDGEFIAGLAELYDDDNWQMFDEDGNVLVTETAEEFEAAARPDVDPSLQNHCVELTYGGIHVGDTRRTAADLAHATSSLAMTSASVAGP